MNHDIEKVKGEVHVLLPDVEVRQLQCAHAADDDGIWFFSRPGKKEEIQLESSTGDLPFIIEHTHTKSGEAKTVETIDEAVQIIRTFFQQTK